MPEATMVALKIEGAIATIRLGRPPMNALCDQLQSELAAAVSRVTVDPAVRAVVLYGGERVFAAGADIKEMATLGPIEALAQTPALTGVAVAPVSLVREKTFGLERVDAANIVGNPNLSQRNVSVGSELTLELEIANVGKTPATLTRLENIVEDGLELVRQKTVYPVENNAFDMKGKRLDYLKTLTVKVPLKATRKGTLELRPRIFFHDQKGFHGSYDFDATSLTIRDLGISGWLKGPKQ